MFQDYKVAYSEQGDVCKEEATSTVTVGWVQSSWKEKGSISNNLR
jgi:hypothetical protein